MSVEARLRKLEEIRLAPTRPREPVTALEMAKRILFTFQLAERGRLNDEGCAMVDRLAKAIGWPYRPLNCHPSERWFFDGFVEALKAIEPQKGA